MLEIGIGSGLNLPFYSRNVKDLIGLEPSPKLLSMVRRNLGSDTPWPELIEGSAEAIPLETHSIDSVVTTWTLCSIPDAALAVREMRRVLRSTGRLLFIGARACRRSTASGGVPAMLDRAPPAI